MIFSIKTRVWVPSTFYLIFTNSLINIRPAKTGKQMCTYIFTPTQIAKISYFKHK